MKNKNKPILFIIIFLLVISAIFFLLNSVSNRSEQITTNKKKKSSNEEIITKLEDNFETFQKEIPIDPALGATRWFGPQNVQFISPSVMLINFEDGHLMGISIVEHNPDLGTFNLLDTTVDYEFSKEKKTQWLKQYSLSGFSIKNYTKNIWRNGKLVEFNDWVEVPEDLFIE